MICRRAPGATAAVSLLLAALAPRAAAAVAPPPPDHIGHRHHLHHHNPPHPAAPEARRFLSRRGGEVLPLPAEEDAFSFVVFGDRTGGPVEGVSVLAEAVYEVNLLEPDLVMTVGDLVQGYNQSPEWLGQMREFKGIMDQLLCPWFPVAGNHDVYWDGPGRPRGEHEADYEAHFAPLWYAFEHKRCWFIVLYSDEGNPRTGRKSFHDPAAQTMSPEQFRWLKKTLERARDARHVFVFLHHPRWLGGEYGDDWNRVHALLAAAGNVRAVFAGHIHHMRYDGRRDGIEYVTLATTGGAQSHAVPRAGYLHHFDIVTVRPRQVGIAAVPVGEVLDVRAITGRLSEETLALARLVPRFEQRLPVAVSEPVHEKLRVRLENPASRPVEVTMTLASADRRWMFRPNHDHRTIAPGASARFTFGVDRAAGGVDGALRMPELEILTDYLAEGFRYSIPRITAPVPLAPRLEAPTPPAPPGAESVLVLDGRDDGARIDDDLLEVPDGPLTLECWCMARRFGPRTGLVTKTERSEFGFFLSGGVPGFSVFLGERYVEAKPTDLVLRSGRWYHLAGVFDGREVRLYVDGVLRASAAGAGPRRRNHLPLLVGADVDGRGRGMSFFEGRIDAVRLSTVARYRGRRFDPPRRPAADAHTALLLNMDAMIGPWLYDQSPHHAHATVLGAPVLAEDAGGGRDGTGRDRGR